jgi:Berberine and berberine like
VCEVWMQSFGGVMARVPPTATAFWHRDARFVVEFGASWATPKAGRDADRDVMTDGVAWTRQLREALRPFANGTYVNFVDLDLGSRSTGQYEYLEVYYGGNAQRLSEAKTKWDPTEVFQFEQSVPPLRVNQTE